MRFALMPLQPLKMSRQPILGPLNIPLYIEGNHNATKQVSKIKVFSDCQPGYVLSVLLKFGQISVSTFSVLKKVLITEKRGYFTLKVFEKRATLFNLNNLKVKFSSINN